MSKNAQGMKSVWDKISLSKLLLGKMSMGQHAHGMEKFPWDGMSIRQNVHRRKYLWDERFMGRNVQVSPPPARKQKKEYMPYFMS
jgi:hypothetical protein